MDTAFYEDSEDATKRLTSDSASAALFLRDGRYVAPGTTWRAPELAAVLRRIAEQGRDGFYTGETASLIVAAMQKSGGIITLNGPRRLHAALADAGGVRLPRASRRVDATGFVRGTHPGADPRASSRAATWLHWAGAPAASIHLLAEAERRAFARRNALLGDPEFGPIATAAFLSKDTAAALRAEITDRASAGSGAPAAPEPRHTTHFSIVDARGNAVALTTTLNESYGSAFTVPGAQFLLNDEMDDFTTKPGAVNAMGLVQGERNAIAPGKRMLSSMTPTLVLDSAGAIELVTGAAGGAYIITGVAHQIVSLLDFHKSLGEAMAAPQFHFQDQPDSLVVEKVAWADTADDAHGPAGAWGQAIAVGTPGEHAEHSPRGGKVDGGFGAARFRISHGVLTEAARQRDRCLTYNE